MIWKLIHLTAFVGFGGALFWMSFFRDGTRRPAKVSGEGRIEFSPDRLAISAWLLIVVYLAGAAAIDLIHSQGKSWNLFNGICFLAYAILFLCSFPVSVVISDDGLEQRYWFRRSKRIRWSEIEEIETSPKSRTVIITAASGTKIVHLRTFADRPGLLLELKQHCGDELPPDFPRESVEGR
jgi:hypothetical protein